MWDPYAEIQSMTLPNGLTVHAAHWPGRPWESMGFLVHSGAEHDPVGLEGLAHFVEHVISENAGSSAKDIGAFFSDCGGSVNLGSTGFPATNYRFFVPTDKAVLAQAFSLFGQMLLSAKLENFIERERDVIIGEYRQHYPTKIGWDRDVREHRMLYAGHWLERHVRPLGDPDSIGRITQKDLQKYYDTHYTPANMSIVGVGGMSLAELVELLSESPFAVVKKGVRTPTTILTTDVSAPLEVCHVVEVSKHYLAPVEFCGYRSIAKIPSSINGSVIRIVRSMIHEVLYDEVRGRRAWAYAINCSRHNFRDFHRFSIGCGSLALKAVDEIEEVVESCLVSVGGRDDLFEQIKRRALAGNFMVDQSAGRFCDDLLLDLADYQRIISLTEIRDDLSRVTMEEVRSVLEWLRPERRWTCITRP
jgi:predicted Zn-dependent peptidase